jgi:hypothetical protein
VTYNNKLFSILLFSNTDIPLNLKTIESLDFIINLIFVIVFSIIIICYVWSRWDPRQIAVKRQALNKLPPNRRKSHLLKKLAFQTAFNEAAPRNPAWVYNSLMWVGCALTLEERQELYQLAQRFECRHDLEELDIGTDEYSDAVKYIFNRRSITMNTQILGIIVKHYPANCVKLNEA